MLQRFYILLIFSCLFSPAFTQPIKDKPIAPFVITLLDREPYSYTQLQKGKEVIILYFSPTCEHCKELTKEIIKHQKQFAKKQIIMVTVDPLNEAMKFADQHALSAYPNIKVGIEREPYVIQKYYDVSYLPFIVSYNAQGKLVALIAQQMKPADIIKNL